MLNKTNYKKTNTVLFQFYEISKIIKLLVTEHRIVFAREWQRGKQGVVQWVYGLSNARYENSRDLLCNVVHKIKNTVVYM